MQNTSCEMPGWMNHKLESRLLGEISTASDMLMILQLKIEHSENKDHDIISRQIEGKNWKWWLILFLFSWAPKSLWTVTVVTILKDACSLEGKLWQPRQCIEKPRHHFADRDPYSQSYGVSRSHVWMWDWDHKEGSALKNWCFWTVVLEKTLESPWTARRSNQSILKEISPGCSLEGLMLKLKLQYFGHLMQRTNSL